MGKDFRAIVSSVASLDTVSMTAETIQKTANREKDGMAERAISNRRVKEKEKADINHGGNNQDGNQKEPRAAASKAAKGNGGINMAEVRAASNGLRCIGSIRHHRSTSSRTAGRNLSGPS